MTVTGPPLIASHQTAVETARAFAERIADGAIERDRSGSLPAREMADFDSTGLLAVTIPRDHGGGGLPPAVLADVARTIAAVDPAVAQTAQGHYLFVDVLLAFGSPKQRQRLLTEVVAGHRIANALAERGTAHAQELGTRLTGWSNQRPTTGGPPHLRGRKYYATGSLTAAWIAITALDDDGTLICAFVPRDARGMTLDQNWDTMGQRSTVSGGVNLDDVEVDPELVLPYAECFQVPQQFGARAQLYHAAIQVGIARGALEDARLYLQTRARPFFEAARAGWAEKAADDPHTIHHFGQMATRVAAAEALLQAAADTLAEVGLIPSDAEAAARGSVAVAGAKAFASEVAVGVASDLFSLTGASAADRRHDLDRHWRNARTHASHDPADWKFHHVGNYLLNGTLPPNHGQL
jgi:SfnB family sulfur acquisition oxidoreductase